MKIVNYWNQKRLMHLFLRDKKGNLLLRKDNTFDPHFYEPNINGKYNGFDGTKLEKITCYEPSEVKKLRSEESFESDILFTRKYILDRINKFDKCDFKYSFSDIEILCNEDEFPKPEYVKFPISSISLYNSRFKITKNWFLGDFGTNLKKGEIDLFYEFVTYLRKANFDLHLGWFFEQFDYPYLANRFSKFPQKYFFKNSSKWNNFATAISPIQKARWVKNDFDVLYPAGSSVVDYLDIFKSVYKREKSYKLNDILEKFLGIGKKYKEVDFSKLNEIVRERNIGDVTGWIELEKKLKLIPYMDDIRRTAMISFEEVKTPLRIVEPFFFREAKEMKIILPQVKDQEIKKGEVEAAYREAIKLGRYRGVTSYDLSGAYLSTVNDLCLDSTNIVEKEDKNTIRIRVTDRVTNEIKCFYFLKQNSEAILPRVARKMLNKKQEYKDLKKITDPNSEEFEDISNRYASFKNISLASWGVLLLKHFRLFDKRVAALITSTVRDLLHYVKDELEKLGYILLYVDTDGIKIENGGENICELLNKLIQKWSMDRFNKLSSIKFEYEGNYERLFINALCRTKGYRKNPNGKLEEEKTGIEGKRKDSSTAMGKIQDELIDMILETDGKNWKYNKSEVDIYLLNEIDKMKNGFWSLKDLAFPARLAKRPEEYEITVTNKKGTSYIKSPGASIRAYIDTCKIIKFKKRIGELYYWCYVKTFKTDIKIETKVYLDERLIDSFDYDVNKEDCKIKLIEKKLFTEEDIKQGKFQVLHKKKKTIHNTLAFDDKKQKHIKEIDYNLMIERNIKNKAQVIYNSLGWDFSL